MCSPKRFHTMAANSASTTATVRTRDTNCSEAVCESGPHITSVMSAARPRRTRRRGDADGGDAAAAGVAQRTDQVGRGAVIRDGEQHVSWCEQMQLGQDGIGVPRVGGTQSQQCEPVRRKRAHGDARSGPDEEHRVGRTQGVDGPAHERQVQVADGVLQADHLERECLDGHSSFVAAFLAVSATDGGKP